MIKIHNVRLGHACNSSSTHSLIAVSPRDRTLTLNEGNAKILAQHFDVVCEQVPAAFAHVLYQDLIAPLFPNYVDMSNQVDADGKWEIEFGPFLQNPKGFEFVKLLFKELCSSNVNFFYGESGIDDDDLTRDDVAGPVIGLLGSGFSTIRVRHDVVGDFWSIYSPNTGTKWRVSFDSLDRPRATKSSVPELVDVKITDFCDKGCKFCYQGSTSRGQHAKVEDLRKIAAALADLEVFEVALGGGEPLSHPDFAEIVDLFHSRGITVNATTASTLSFTRPELIRNLGAIAVSVNSREDLATAIDDKFFNSGTKINLQHVVGTKSLDYSVGLLNSAMRKFKSCIDTLCLLGYKSTNRGLAFAPQVHKFDPYELVTRFRETSRYVDIAVDTAFIAQHEASVRRIVEDTSVYDSVTVINDPIANDPEALYTREEGKFSMYIDAVTKTAGKSSYHLDSFVQLKDLSSHSIIEAFKLW